jgi:aminopeptidase 2
MLPHTFCSLDVKQSTSSVSFNCHPELHLDHASLLYGEDLTLEQEALDKTQDQDQARTTLKFANSLGTGTRVQLHLSFRGTLTSKLRGYFCSTYDVVGNNQYYALTQFQPTDARRAFPCWDEPLLKATFAITLISRTDTVNLSNMPVASEGPFEPLSEAGSGNAYKAWLLSLSARKGVNAKEWKTTEFMTSPPMSTYIVAFANGAFEHIESFYTSPLSGKTRPIRAYATKDVIGQAQFVLDVTTKVVPLYEQVFDVEYPLPKLDTLIASDFEGAMENWGLIIGRKIGYCVDPEQSNTAQRKRAASLQSHEVAHQWFGNITTPAWWDNLYLNEGFASLMSDVIADK